jgi:hypothetical protein
MRSRVTGDEAAVRAPVAAVALDRSAREAAADPAPRQRLADVLADIRAQLGPATDEETTWARDVLGL